MNRVSILHSFIDLSPKQQVELLNELDEDSRLEVRMSLNKDSGLYEVSKRIVKIQEDIIQRINDISISTIEQNVVLSKSQVEEKNRESIIVPWDDRKGFNPALEDYRSNPHRPLASHQTSLKQNQIVEDSFMETNRLSVEREIEQHTHQMLQSQRQVQQTIEQMYLHNNI